MSDVADAACRFNPASTPDYLPTPKMRDLQLARLKAVVRRAYENVDLFRTRLVERGVAPESMRSHGRYPAVALHDQERSARHLSLRAIRQPDAGDRAAARVERHHRKAHRGGLHPRGCRVWTNAMMRCFAACGINQGDVVQNAYGYGLFTGGLGAHYGAEGLGRDRDPDFGREHRPADHGDEGLPRDRHLLHAQLLHPPARAGGGAGRGRQQPPRCASACSARSRGPTRCGVTSRARAAYAPSTSTGCRKLSAPGSPSNASARMACTSWRTISIPRSSTRRRGEPVPDGVEGELVLHNAFQARHAHDPLPHPRHHHDPPGSLSLRPDAAPHAADRAAAPTT